MYIQWWQNSFIKLIPKISFGFCGNIVHAKAPCFPSSHDPVGVVPRNRGSASGVREESGNDLGSSWVCLKMYVCTRIWVLMIILPFFSYSFLGFIISSPGTPSWRFAGLFQPMIRLSGLGLGALECWVDLKNVINYVWVAWSSWLLITSKRTLVVGCRGIWWDML